jgi:AcrR family transcriptional regulator
VNSVKINRRKPRTAYHHGDLRQQLILAAEEILKERGVQGFTLREAARRAGVSPAAPAHHFKDARGLLTEVALLGFREFAQDLAAADRAGGTDAAQRLKLQGRAYVSFALKHPARFQLMFLHDKHDMNNAEFAVVSKHAFEILQGAIHAATRTPADSPLSAQSYGFLLATWSIVHGFSHLALGGELRGADGAAADSREVLENLLPLMLEHLPQPVPKGSVP